VGGRIHLEVDARFSLSSESLRLLLAMGFPKSVSASLVLSLIPSLAVGLPKSVSGVYSKTSVSVLRLYAFTGYGSP